METKSKLNHTFLHPQGEYFISTDPALIDVERLYKYLSQESYWAKEMPRDLFDTSIANSLPFSVLTNSTPPEFVGFARVVTDYAVFGYLCDLYIEPKWQGKGLGTWLAKTATEFEGFKRLRRFMLFTKDAHEVYKKCGFAALERPDFAMAIHRPYTTYDMSIRKSPASSSISPSSTAVQTTEKTNKQ